MNSQETDYLQVTNDTIAPFIVTTAYEGDYETIGVPDEVDISLDKLLRNIHHVEMVNETTARVSGKLEERELSKKYRGSRINPPEYEYDKVLLGWEATFDFSGEDYWGEGQIRIERE